MNTETAAVSVSDEGGVRFITFDRPAKLNALTIAELREVARLLTAEPLRAAVFTGSGPKAFSAGMHIQSFRDMDVDSARELISAVRDFVGAVRTAPYPTIAAVNGYCLGAAFELALACDVRISVRSAGFGLPEVKVGIPSVVDASLLQQHVGLSLAKEMILTGDVYPAEEMWRLGLLNLIVEPGELDGAVRAMLPRLTAHTPAVIAAQKRLFETWQNTSLSEGIEASVEEFAQMFADPSTRAQVEAHFAAVTGGK
ncbi:MAG: enoyl-CoA hydratase [Streptosporangiales bacterium]|nr:enoyl-CoA hydratase [Streptosporangiales bacterium]